MIELTKGQELALATDDGVAFSRIRMGIGWDKERTAGFIASGAPDVDLDASAIEFSGGRAFDYAFYNNLTTRDGSVVHLGDNLTGRGDGDDEAITVDLTKVYAKVDTIVFLVSSYQGHTLEWINNAYCRVVADGAEGPDDPETEIARLTLTAGVPKTGVVLAKILRDGDHWRLRAIGAGVRVTKPSDSVTALARFL